jgi:hypothetical protein
MTAISRNRPPANPIPKRRYLLAIACYLAIPVVFIAGGAMHQLIDPEWARRSADYVGNYRLLELLAQGVLMAAGMLALVLWLATCFFLLKARERSVVWLLLAVAGPLGFTFIATLRDRAPASDDLYQQIVPRLKLYLRIPFEIAAFVGIWMLAILGMMVAREAMIQLASIRTGTPVEAIVAIQDVSSGMYAFAEGLQVLYLVPLLYLLWPVVFNLAGRLFRRSHTTRV